MSQSPTLSDLEVMARGAGEILRAGYGQQFRIKQKGVIDLVTEFDHRSEAYVLEAIHARFPEHRILAEESGARGGTTDPIWYVDPLDGTINYAHGVPIFAVSIAYAVGDAVQLGVVYDPMRDELYAAQKGGGATLNGGRLQVSMPVDLDHSLLVTGFPYDIRTHPQNNLEEYKRLSLHSQGVRRLGSAAIDLCYVAAGRFDGFWELRLNPWDVAAGGLIAQEAGAIVTHCRGGADYIGPPASVLAASPAIYAPLLELLNRDA